MVRLRTFRLCAALVSYPVLLAGCENMSDTGRTQAEGTLLGAGAGAALGAIFGGGNAALLGSTLGAATGLGLGTLVANKKQGYAATESYYDGQIRLVEKKNRELASYNDALGREIAGYNRDIAQLQGQLRNGNANLQAARRTQEQVQARYAESTQLLEDGRRDLEKHTQVMAQARQSGATEDWVQREAEQVAALRSHVGVLQQQVDVMASQSNQLQQFR